jgi:NodT family efflux transporter outer membrane factor (OMF) lipoprotein
MNRHLRPLAAALLGLLAGCASVGPNYAPPPLPGSLAAHPPGAFAENRPAALSTAPLPARWWQLYNDPRLDALIGEALIANTDVRVAVANLERAEAVVQGTRASAGVQTSLGGGVSFGQTSTGGVGPSGGTHPAIDAGLGVSYAVDVVGRIRREIEAASADAQTQAAAADLARITVVANVVGAYTDACASGARLQVAQHSAALQQQSLGLSERGAAAGLYSSLDLSRSRALLAQLNAALPPLDGARQTALYRLAVLMGRAPTAFPAELANCTTIPTLDQPIPVGDGSALIRRRPDIRQSDRQLAAATADIGVVTADLYPSVSLGASLGTASRKVGTLLDRSALRFNVGPLISWSFPNTRVAHARIEEAGAAQRAALANFDGVVLSSLREAETALTLYARHLDENTQLRVARDESLKAAGLQQQLLRGGTVSSLETLDVERSLANAEAALAASDATLATDRVRIFLALGGGWENEAATP